MYHACVQARNLGVRDTGPDRQRTVRIVVLDAKWAPSWPAINPIIQLDWPAKPSAGATEDLSGVASPSFLARGCCADAASPLGRFFCSVLSCEGAGAVAG